jgi:hypothetical protein
VSQFSIPGRGTIKRTSTAMPDVACLPIFLLIFVDGGVHCFHHWNKWCSMQYRYGEYISLAVQYRGPRASTIWRISREVMVGWDVALTVRDIAGREWVEGAQVRWAQVRAMHTAAIAGEKQLGIYAHNKESLHRRHIRPGHTLREDDKTVAYWRGVWQIIW